MQSWLEISAQRLKHNVAAVRAAAGGSQDAAEILGVVKADGYGHGAAIVAPVLIEAGVRWLGVDDAEQGAAIRRLVGEHARILVMSGMEPEDADAIVRHKLTPVVWTPRQVHALEAAAAAANESIRVHLEIDSGMSRQGAAQGGELAEFLRALQSAKHIELEGWMSHLSSAEVAHSSVTATQRARFAEAIAQLRSGGLTPKILHLANSSAVDEGSTSAWVREQARALGATVMVRPGLALYGYTLPLEGATSAHAATLNPQLQPVLAWKTRILATREILPGQTAGYGATFTATRPMRLALLPVGYADGFRREASSGLGNGWVIVAGQRANVAGRISMNLTLVDITEIAAANEGVEVTLLGEGVTAEDHARWCDTIAYEILCGLRPPGRPV